MEAVRSSFSRGTGWTGRGEPEVSVLARAWRGGLKGLSACYLLSLCQAMSSPGSVLRVIVDGAYFVILDLAESLGSYPS